MTAGGPSLTPYPGLESYRWAQRRGFFGREQDAFKLQTLVLGNRLSLLHALSGAGKSSLIQAGLLAPLEQHRNWMVAIARPSDDPVLALARAVIDRVFPNPSSEAIAIDSLLEAAASSALTDAFNSDCTLSDIRTEFDAQQRIIADDASGQRRHRAHQFVSQVLAAPGIDQSDPTLAPAAFQRFLDYANGRRALTSFLAALLRQSEIHDIALDWPGGVQDAVQIGNASAFASELSQLTLGQLRDFMQSDSLAALTAAFESRHIGPLLSDETEHDAQGLVTFLAGISADCLNYKVLDKGERSISAPSGLLVVLDQFEEHFTLFSHEERNRFFDQLEALYLAGRMDDGTHPNLSQVHILVSMRDEHVADLDRLRGFDRNISANTLHLNYIAENEIRNAIEAPALRYGFRVDEAVTDLLIDELSEDDRTIKPALVQIVLAHVWEKYGDQITRAIGEDGDVVFEREDLERLGSTSVVFNKYVDGVVERAAEVELDADAQPELKQYLAMEILDKLTQRGLYRVVLNEAEILEDQAGEADGGMPTVNPNRKALLGYVQSSGLVRRYRRRSRQNIGTSSARNDTFVEITHETLIPHIKSVLETRMRRDRTLRHLQSALGRLTLPTLLRDARREDRPQLTEAEVEALDLYGDWIGLDQTATEVVFRACLGLGLEGEVPQRFAERLDKGDVERTSTADLMEGCDRWIANEEWLDRVSLVGLLSTDWSPQTDNERTFVLRSLLEEGNESDRDLIVRFGKELRP